MPRSHRTTTVPIAQALFWTTAAAVAVRLFFGVNFTDETYFVSLASGFVHGRKPFVDELFVHQSAALVTTPLVALYEWLFGRDGLVLFLRMAYLGVSVAVARALVRRLTMAGIESSAAWASGAFLLAFVPAAIPSLTYTTQGYLGLLGGVLLLHSPPRPLLLGVLSGVALLGIAGVSYAPLAPLSAVAALALGLRLWILRASDRRVLSLCAAVTLLCALGLAAVALSLGWHEGLSRSLEFHRAVGVYGGAAEKLQVIYRDLRRYLGMLALALAGIGILAAPARIPAWLRLGLAAGAMAAGAWRAWHALDGDTLPNYWVLVWGMAAAFGLITWRRLLPETRSLFAALGVVGAAAAVIVSWASSGAFSASPLGLVLPAVMALCLPPVWASHRSENIARPWLAVMAAIVAFQVGHLFCYSYRDSAPYRLNTLVRDGAFAGMLTTAERARFLSELEADLRTVEPGRSSVAFLDYFPAGYLLTDLRPRTPAAWALGRNNVVGEDLGYRAYYARYYAEETALPDVVVQMIDVPSQDGRLTRIEYAAQDPLLIRLFGESRYRTEIERPLYRIYTKVVAVRALTGDETAGR